MKSHTSTKPVFNTAVHSPIITACCVCSVIYSVQPHTVYINVFRTFITAITALSHVGELGEVIVDVQVCVIWSSNIKRKHTHTHTSTTRNENH